MKQGGGKAKGAAFERAICQALSVWVTQGVKKDCFWRSAMSGGRSTVARKSGVELSRQAGDICSVSPEGHALTDLFYIETKFYRDLCIDSFILGNGILQRFWDIARQESAHYSRRPMLIAKQNNYPTLLIMRGGDLRKIATQKRHWDNYIAINEGGSTTEVRLFDDVMNKYWFRTRI